MKIIYRHACFSEADQDTTLMSLCLDANVFGLLSTIRDIFASIHTPHLTFGEVDDIHSQYKLDLRMLSNVENFIRPQAMTKRLSAEQQTRVSDLIESKLKEFDAWLFSGHSARTLRRLQRLKTKLEKNSSVFDDIISMRGVSKLYFDETAARESDCWYVISLYREEASISFYQCHVFVELDEDDDTANISPIHRSYMQLLHTQTPGILFVAVLAVCRFCAAKNYKFVRFKLPCVGAMDRLQRRLHSFAPYYSKAGLPVRELASSLCDYLKPRLFFNLVTDSPLPNSWNDIFVESSDDEEENKSNNSKMPRRRRRGRRKGRSRRSALKRRAKQIRPRIPLRILRDLKLLLRRKNEVGGEFVLNKHGKITSYKIERKSSKNRDDLVVMRDDYLIEFHTHPNPNLIELPSPHDLKVLMKKKVRNTRRCRGEFGVVISRTGIASYKFLGSKMLDSAAFKEIQAIMDLGSNSPASNKKQIKQIESKFPFCIKFRTWPQILKTNGLIIGKMKFHHK